MTLQLWDLINPADATEFVRIVPDPFPDPLIEVLPERLVNDVRAATARLTKTNTSATFRSWNAESPIGQRTTTYQVDQVNFPPISEKLPLTEADRMQLFLAQTSGTNPVVAQRLMEDAYNDLATIAQRIKNRMALARADVLVDGKFTLSGENGLTLETDYKFAVGQLPTASTLWSDHANSHPIDDENAWQLFLTLSPAGRPATRAFTSLSVLQHLQNNAQYKQNLYPGLAVGNIGMLSQTQVNAVRVNFGLPPITVVEHSLIDPTGATVRLMPQNKIIYTCDGIGETQWGVTPDALEFARTNAIQQGALPGLVGATYYSVDPWTRWTKVSGCGLPVLADPTGVLTATVA